MLPLMLLQRRLRKIAREAGAAPAQPSSRALSLASPPSIADLQRPHHQRRGVLLLLVIPRRVRRRRRGVEVEGAAGRGPSLERRGVREQEAAAAALAAAASSSSSFSSVAASSLL